MSAQMPPPPSNDAWQAGSPAKKPVWKRWWFWVASAFVVLVAVSALSQPAADVQVAELSTSQPTSQPTTPAAPQPTETVAPPVPASPPAPVPPPAPAEPEFTVSQENAIESAESYLDFTAFSRSGLIGQLSSDYGEGFSVADATFAVDHISVNWNEQAAKSAKSYLAYSSFSRQGLIEQLESEYGEGFTHSQAVYGVDQTGL